MWTPNLIVVCVDNVDNEAYQGRIYHLYRNQPIYFANILQMIKWMEAFYNELDTASLTFFLVLVFTFIVLIISSINLAVKNNSLILKIKDLKNKELENKVKKEELEKKIKEEVKVEPIKEVKEEVKPSVKPVISEESKPYSKNVLKDISTRNQTSPISIKKEVMNKVKEEIKDNKKENISFTETLSKQLEESQVNEPIELTDYERKQEEEAIISYKELLNASKDRLYKLNDDEETVDFISELKSFRSSL